MEDLQAFDSEDVVREIFASKIPTISAIGHEDHWTLADFIYLGNDQWRFDPAAPQGKAFFRNLLRLP